MKPLRRALENEIQRLQEDLDYTNLDTEALITSMNQSQYMMKINGLARNDFKLICNDACRDYYGVETNDISHMNMRFYYNYFHPVSYVGLIKNHQFFSRNDLGYLEIVYTLKDHNEDYQKVVGISKTVAWDKRGKPLYALSLMCLQKDYLLNCAMEHFSLQGISRREQDTLSFLIRGCTNSQIASSLNVSTKTVEKEVSTLYSKAGIKSRAEFLRFLNLIE